MQKIARVGLCTYEERRKFYFEMRILNLLNPFLRFKHLSLNRKAILVLVVASLSLSVLSSSVFFALEYRESERQLQRDVTAKAGLLASDIDASLVFLDEEEAAALVDQAMRDHRIHGVAISDMGGTLFLQRLRNGLNVWQLAYGQEIVSEDGYTRVSVPVNYNGQQVGRLTLIYDNSEQNITSAQYWRLLITFLISSSIVTAIILLLMHRLSLIHI